MLKLQAFVLVGDSFGLPLFLDILQKLRNHVNHTLAESPQLFELIDRNQDLKHCLVDCLPLLDVAAHLVASHDQVAGLDHLALEKKDFGQTQVALIHDWNILQYFAVD